MSALREDGVSKLARIAGIIVDRTAMAAAASLPWASLRHDGDQRRLGPRELCRHLGLGIVWHEPCDGPQTRQRVGQCLLVLRCGSLQQKLAPRESLAAANMVAYNKRRGCANLSSAMRFARTFNL